ncbi:2-C-methyl-D-erythritol 4-phosphate cytidylyltransferase [Brachybacterium sp. EF45031]|nr:2-C-methyl-D-erythritol 4-phosphate cytidylyltransferase [Brachybacterium sillae]
MIPVAPPRVGGELPALRVLGGRSVLARLLDTLASLGLPRPTLLADRPTATTLRAAVAGDVAVQVVPAGDRLVRLRAALQADETLAHEDLLLIDAERALTPSEVVQAVLAQAASEPELAAVVPVVPVTDSVKAAGGDGLRNVDRETLASVQHPRFLRAGWLDRAVSAPPASTGASSAGPEEIARILALGGGVRMVPGSHSGFAVVDRLSLWQAQIALGIARDTRGRHGLPHRG